MTDAPFPTDAFLVDYNKEPALAYYTNVNPRYLALNLISFGVRTIDCMEVIKHWEAYQKVAIFQNKAEHVEHFMDNFLFDIIKLTTAFENFMKAQLLLNNILVHKISDAEKFKALRKKQAQVPVLVSEVTSIEEFVLDIAKDLYISNGIVNNTISISTMLKDGYQDVIKLPKDVMKCVSEYNEFRNNLHFYYMGMLETGKESIDKLLLVHDYAANVMGPLSKQLLLQHEEAVKAR